MVRKLKGNNLLINPSLERVAENEYIFIFPQKADKYLKIYQSAVENLENDRIKEAENELEQVTAVLRGHFDSYNLLIEIASGYHNYSKVTKFSNQGEKDVKNIIEKLGNEDRICWKYGSNRDMLNFIHNLGVRAMETWDPIKAKDAFITLLTLDPSDEQNVGETLMDILFQMNDLKNIISVTKIYNHTKDPSMVYNEILALYITGDLNSAKLLIENFNGDNLKIYKRLIEGAKAIENSTPESLQIKTSQEKFLSYWEKFGWHWELHKGSLDFLKNCISDAQLDLDISDKIENVPNDSCSTELSLEVFRDNLMGRGLKESTVKEHLENISLFDGYLTSLDEVKEKLSEISNKEITKSKFNKIITSLNQYFRFRIKNKEELNNILKELKTLKENFAVSVYKH